MFPRFKWSNFQIPPVFKFFRSSLYLGKYLFRFCLPMKLWFLGYLHFFISSMVGCRCRCDCECDVARKVTRDVAEEELSDVEMSGDDEVDEKSVIASSTEVSSVSVKFLQKMFSNLRSFINVTSFSSILYCSNGDFIWETRLGEDRLPDRG